MSWENNSGKCKDLALEFFDWTTLHIEKLCSNPLWWVFLIMFVLSTVVERHEEIATVNYDSFYSAPLDLDVDIVEHPPAIDITGDPDADFFLYKAMLEDGMISGGMGIYKSHGFEITVTDHGMFLHCVKHSE